MCRRSILGHRSKVGCGVIFSRRMEPALDYRRVLPLDAEDLAETGVLAAYDAVCRELTRYVPRPAEVEEVFDPDAPSYLVRCRGEEFLIYAPDIPPEEGWGRAAHALFSIVNAQLADTAYRFYALYGGNDLGGTFLTRSECLEARRALPRREDWPYLPTLEAPRFGQPYTPRR